MLCAEQVVGDEPFAVILADDLIEANPGVTAQLVESFRRTGASVLAVEDVPREDTSKYGIVAAEPILTAPQRCEEVALQSTRLSARDTMKREEWERYRRQAAHTLVSAQGDRANAAFDWACFKAHQAAELAVKGYVRATAHYATGHSILRLLGEVGTAPPATLVDCARSLDKAYIPARDPDAYDAGAPMDYYTAADADAALDCARQILDWLDDLAGR